MEKVDTIWRIFSVYLLVLLFILIIFFLLLAGSTTAQVTVTHYNAGWNSTNDVEWLKKLEDCNTVGYIDISTDKEAQTKYKIAVIPTIIIFKDNEEVARFQADLSFKMVATREEVQEEINDQLMSDF